MEQNSVFRVNIIETRGGSSLKVSGGNRFIISPSSSDTTLLSHFKASLSQIGLSLVDIRSPSRHWWAFSSFQKFQVSDTATS